VVDASMTLLREVMERPLDPGYAAAAERRAAGRVPGRRALALTLVLALICGAVTARAIAELRRPQPGAEQARAALQAQIRRRSATVDSQQRQLDQIRSEVAMLQAQTLAGSGDAALAQRAGLLQLVSGLAPVTGPGLQITMADAPATNAPAGTDPRADGGSDQSRVLDRDVQTVVNGLWAAGAEAVSINGQRLTARSAIRYAGQAILVDFRPLVPPYVISAVGDTGTLQTRFAAGSAGSYLQALRDNYGIRATIVSSSRLQLPGAGGTTTRLAYAKPVQPAGSGGGTASGSPSGSSAGSPSASAPGPAAPSTTPEVSP
jgi:uncharacterized protein YlxW (UPF0749 family)